ncbi:hypothetical protein [Reyranella sp.]|uniref:hypothetical protein n=1 Tax=Reyranella sp. TaxID=1929291 RepID=UPI003C7D6DB1
MKRCRSLEQVANYYAGLSGGLYASLEFAVKNLEEALAGIPKSNKMLRRRLILRISSYKEYLERHAIASSDDDAPTPPETGTAQAPAPQKALPPAHAEPGGSS